MADVSVTPANVSIGATAVVETGTAGEAIDPGELIYMDSSDSNLLKLAKASGTSAQATIKGVAVSGASAANQRVSWVGVAGTEVTVGAVLTQGKIYVLSANAGKFAPEADLVSGNYVSVVGVAKSTSVLVLVAKSSGATV